MPQRQPQRIRSLARLETLEPRWKLIQAGVASIQGDADDLVPPANQDFILRNISSTNIKYQKRVPKMNHFVPWDHPELIKAAIERFEAATNAN